MTAIEAYPDCPDIWVRARSRYAVGDMVRVGPAYDDRSYAHRNDEGQYVVVGVCQVSNDYYLASPLAPTNAEWVMIAHAQRLTLVK